MKKIFLFVALISLGSAFYLFKDKFSSESNKEINLVVNNYSKSFDPAVAYNADSLTLMAQSLEGLYQYHYLKRPFEVIPALAAAAPTISPDGLIYTIQIKDKVYYHPHKDIIPKNREVTVDDFILQIKRLAFKPLNSTGSWLFEGRLKGFNEFRDFVGNDFNKMLITPIAGIKKIDTYTLELHLTRPEPNMMYYLAMEFVTPVPIELISAYKNDLQNVLVGTGPYVYKGLVNDIYYYEKNPNYREEFYPTNGDRYANTQNLIKQSKTQLPFIRTLKFHVLTTEDDRWQAFQSKKVDLLDVPKKYLSEVNNLTKEELKNWDEREVEVNQFPSLSSRWLGFNMKDEILGTNLYLRKALAHAIDYEQYLEYITKNTNLRSNSIYSPSIEGYAPSHTPPYKYNLELAKKYLAMAGYKPGELTLTYSTRGTQEIHFKEAEFMQAQFSAIGINLKVNVLSFTDFLKLGRTGKLQLWTDSWIYDYPDSENILQLLISKNHPGINKSGFSDTVVDKLYDKLTKTLDKDQRIDIMRSVENRVETQIPWILLVYDSAYVLQYSKVKNYRKSFFTRNFVKYLEIK